MTVFDLFDSIGDVNDEAIEKAKQPIRHSRKAFAAIVSVAACAVFACTAVLIVLNMNKNDNTDVTSRISSDIGTSSVKSVNEESTENGTAGGASSESPVKEYSEETAVEEMFFDVYSIVDGKLVSKVIKAKADAQGVFMAWKSENYIGNDVELISVKLNDNGTTEYSEYSGVGTATHKTGDHTVYTLTITKNIEEYYEGRNEELLLESLEKTMTGMCDPKPDEYKLVLSDVTEDEESESNRIDPDDIQYNDQGEILE